MKYLYLASLLLLLSSCQNKKLAQKDQRPPNVIIIFTDDQGYQDIGCFGSPNIKTPQLDAMAAAGTKFTQFYVAQPVCSASRAALLTGCYPNRLGIHGAYMPRVRKGLHLEEETIAEILKPLDYATAIYGKWHLGSEAELLPTRQGFDEYFGIPYSNDMWPYHPWQGTKFDFPALPLMENEKVIDTLEDQSQITIQYTERAVKFIEQNKTKPFFLYVAHSMPHVPLFVSNKFKGKSKAGLYGDVIEEIDWSTGEIVAALKEYDLEENTLVIFTSDNGPWLSYGTHAGSALPLREGKGTAWEGGVRVPCIMQWKGKIPANRTVSRPAMTIDLLPTIAHITGARLPERKIDGKNMSDLMLGKDDAPPHQDAYFFYHQRNELQAVLSGDGRWKLYFPYRYRTLNGRKGNNDGLPIEYEYHQLEEMELYDLKNDISETQNVARQQPEILANLVAQAEEMRTELGDALTEREGMANRAVGRTEEVED